MQPPSSPQVALGQPDTLDARIVESINDCATILDFDGRLLHINAAGLRLLECAGDEKFENRSFADLFERDGNVAAQDAVATARAGKNSQFIATSRSPSGRVKWWDVAVSPITAPDGNVAQVLAISRDITDQKRKDEFLALEHSMLETITSGSQLDDVLEGLVFLIEQYSEDAICCVLLLGEDGKTVQRTSAPNFSESTPGLSMDCLLEPASGPVGLPCIGNPGLS